MANGYKKILYQTIRISTTILVPDRLIYFDNQTTLKSTTKIEGNSHRPLIGL